MSSAAGTADYFRPCSLILTAQTEMLGLKTIAKIYCVFRFIVLLYFLCKFKFCLFYEFLKIVSLVHQCLVAD